MPRPCDLSAPDPPIRELAGLPARDRLAIVIAVLNRRGLKRMPAWLLADLAGVSEATVYRVSSAALSRARLAAAQIIPDHTSLLP